MWEAFDFETAGTAPAYALQPWRMREREAHIRCWARAGRDSSGKLNATCRWVETEPHIEIEKLWDYLQYHAASGTTLVGWNIPFDIQWLLALNMRDPVMDIHWLDGSLLLRRVLATTDPRQKYGLKETVAQWLPQYAGYNEDIDFDATSPEGKARLMEYNKMDALMTYTLSQLLWGKLNKHERRNALIEAASLPMLAWANLEGLRIDRQALQELDTTLVQRATEAMAALSAAEPTIGNVELTNTNQIASLLFERWGLPITKRTATGKPSVDKDVLTELAELDERVAYIRTWRQTQNTRTKFCTKVAESLDYNGGNTTHPQARCYGTYTGRVTYSSTMKYRKDRVRQEVASEDDNNV